MGLETIKKIWNWDIEQTPKKIQPERTTEEISHELQEAMRVRRMLGPNLKKIKGGVGAERGGLGSGTQKRLVRADREIACLRAELDARSGKSIK